MDRDQLTEIESDLFDMLYHLQAVKALSMLLEPYSSFSITDAVTEMIVAYTNMQDEICSQTDTLDNQELRWAHRAYEEAVS